MMNTGKVYCCQAQKREICRFYVNSGNTKNDRYLTTKNGSRVRCRRHRGYMISTSLSGSNSCPTLPKMEAKMDAKSNPALTSFIAFPPTLSGARMPSHLLHFAPNQPFHFSVEIMNSIRPPYCRFKLAPPFLSYGWDGKRTGLFSLSDIFPVHRPTPTC